MIAPVRIAMWSGPRNLSTAMMRSFGARSDVSCWDEPFYAAYLALTGLDHPLRAEILARHERDPHRVAHALAHEQSARAILYQKHMTHHMIEGVPRDWMAHVRNAFLIRHPARVLASYANKMEDVSLDAIGFPQQAELFDRVANELGQAPIVIDGDDILSDPLRALTALCRGLEIPFDQAMLTWAPGPRPEDGAWAPHWYDTVWRSTGFAEPAGALPAIPSEFRPILECALPLYESLAIHKL
ncbi:MAG: HAD family hydrolase [Hyphomonadaceae bacterium]|nr:HAD family hydrolase [Hyphomonadaceae bacterium]